MNPSTPPQATSMVNPHYSSPGSPPSQYNTFTGNQGYSQGNTTPTPGGASYGSILHTPQLNHPNQPSPYNTPVVSVTDYSTTPQYVPANMGVGGVTSTPYPGSNGGAGNYGYEQEYVPPPTDFDALFSGKVAPSLMITGPEHASHLNSQKANRVLGIDDPRNLVYENSGYSRAVHFDVSDMDFGEEYEYEKVEAQARKRREHPPNFSSFDAAAESVTNIPKKSKSLFLSRSHAKGHDRWLEWSEKVKVEAELKREQFLKKQEEAAKKQLPAPIRKARKESVKFVSKQSVPLEEETPLSKAISAMEQTLSAKTSVTGPNKQHSKDKYTVEQWERLHQYWDHGLFQRTRPIGFAIALIAIIAAIPPIISTRWIKYDMMMDVNFTYALPSNQSYYVYPEYNCSTVDINGTCYYTYQKFSHIEHHGFWYNCTDNLTTYTGINDPECRPMNRTGKYGWQSAVIGLLLFSLCAGLLASILTTCGVCSTSLAKKVYYYHSAGEIYFVCGVCSMSALVTYTAVIEKSKDTPEHVYGIGFYLAWAMPVCYYISALFMTLDDMIHSITNDCCLMCRGRKGKGQENLLSSSPANV